METMKMTDIRREPLPVHDWADERVQVLATEAEELLGYKKLRELQQTKQDQAPIACALSRLEIEPLNASDVLRYKNEMQIERTRAKFEQWLSQAREGTEVNTFIGADWDLTAIDQYRQPIPEFVLNKAIQIKKECPEAYIFIDHLEDSPDPFMVVQNSKNRWDSGERYYIEVWDEPRFEGRIR